VPIFEGESMRVWYDTCTGKHVRYGVAVASCLRSLGHEVILTTRKHPDTLPLAEFLNEKIITVGRYNPKNFLTRLKESARRQLLFCGIFEKNAPDVAISHGSVDQCRVAFGLRIPVISTFDTPYAEAVHRLTLPLADCIIASKAIPRRIIKTYNVKAKTIGFDGVDEVAWIKGFVPRVRYDFGKPLIVIRQYEEKAVYTKEKLDLLVLAKKLRRLGKVVFLSRYSRKLIKELIVPKKFVDSVSLVAQADLFIGAGGTIAREAALQGTPAITVETFRGQYVNDYLAKKGFPIFKAKHSNTFKLAEKLLSKKCNVKHLLAELENPVDVIADVVRKIREG
jgi:predicted glycosyltransferase